MPGSQLKRLKASLKDQGIIGAQKSKKQKRQIAQDAKGTSDKRLLRSEALESIREQFNPFQFKTNARGPKFDVTTLRPANDRASKGIHGRPGVAKGKGEERRRETLLVEMQRRNKVGGIIDRRFGESDPSMSLEDKMIERFTREQQRSHKKNSMFDLEDEDEEGTEELTHMGKALKLRGNELLMDDFDGEDLPSNDDSDDGMHPDRKSLKRRRPRGDDDGDDDDADEDAKQPEKKKTSKEIYEEVIAKSKSHKYERQAAKEEDEDIIMELNKSLPELQSLLFQRQKPAAKDGNDERPSATIAGMDKSIVNKDYDLRVRLLATDKRAQPAERTQTEEEKAEEAAKRLKELEEKRLKRMRGQWVSDDEDEDRGDIVKKQLAAADEPVFDPFKSGDDDEFGLGKGIKLRPTAAELGFDDEDDFLIDDDLVTSGSDIELEESDDMEDDEESDDEQDFDPDDDEFVKGLLTAVESKDSVFQASSKEQGDDKDGVPYTFNCPQTLAEMVETFKGVDMTKLPVAVQRIRALYHPKLDSGNKESLGNFSQALIQYVAYLGDNLESGWFPTLENLSRHIHSLAKTFPIEVAKGYRAHIQDIGDNRPLALTVGDLVIFTAIGTTFPTSDHFHQVATPAILTIARFLGQKIPQSLADYATGTYLSILALQYQQLSKRYVPELMNFCLNTLCSLAHQRPQENLGLFPLHEPATGIRIKGARETTAPTESEANSLKVAIISTTAAVLKAAAETWCSVPAFYETFQPAARVLQHLTSKANSAHLPAALVSKLADTTSSLARLLQLANISRRPLELHHHRPSAIRTYVPKFEDSFDPNKHYDPDRERAEGAKLRAEHKRERKGAMRELRKDASFMARENLRVKKEKDEAYEKKYKRLVAEIQGSEGQAANQYEREKAARQKKNAKARGGR
ncbi:nucleolar protein 14 [Lasiosphaeria miniovina]|uniref:Nucleolar protein 14 n=1 Tax=Lasiosphaeria miniovina TaxID=1954250 RepID=A0AA40EDH7_9PEZI|nr:nucleolar protein 14 [Lasiosphaeria miniovina]KAK0733431.1 nucleolar protein 14 [Lasiosphaeria miniovina]